MSAEMAAFADMFGSTAERFGLSIIPCTVAFDAGWALVDRLLFVSPDLTAADLDLLTSWLKDRLGPKLRLVADA